MPELHLETSVSKKNGRIKSIAESTRNFSKEELTPVSTLRQMLSTGQTQYEQTVRLKHIEWSRELCRVSFGII